MFGASKRHTCIACLRPLEEIEPEAADGSAFDRLTMVRFEVPAAPARGFLCMCRSCSRAVVAAFACAGAALAREAPTDPPPADPPPRRSA